MKEELIDKENKLIDILKYYGRVAIGFSGGVDSSLLVYYAVKVLGRDNVLALTGISDIVVDNDRKMAEEVVSFTKVNHQVLEREELNDSDFVKNDKMRCYYCKKLFFSMAKNHAKKLGFEIFLDGTNASDKNDYRPGEVAIKELGIKSPLKESGITKEDVYLLSENYSLPTKNKTSDSCFATRIPYGETITKKALKEVGEAERFLHEKGFSVVRVRHHGSLAKIEVKENDLSSLMESNMRHEVFKKFNEIGFLWVSVDILGYNMGSMNKSIL